MATFTPGLGEWFASWAHPIWFRSGGVARRATTSSAIASCWAVGAEPDVIAHGDLIGHGWVSGYTYDLDARVEYNYASSGGGASWRSLQAGNVGHQPGISPTWWELIDEGLGADDANWIAIPGIQRPDRLNDANAGGTYSIHFCNYHGVGVPAAMRWSQAFTGGQWAGGGANPAVRMSASADTCYHGVLGDGEGWIYRRVTGVDTLIAHFFGTTFGTTFLWAHGTTIGIGSADSTAGSATQPPSFGYLPAWQAVEVLGTVQDAGISEAVGPYVGARIAPQNYDHELYGGSYGFLTASAGPVAGGEVTLSGSRVPGSTPTVNGNATTTPTATTWTYTAAGMVPGPNLYVVTDGIDTIPVTAYYYPPPQLRDSLTRHDTPIIHTSTGKTLPIRKA